MSSYNNYDKASNNYDLGRYPDGANLQIAMLQGYLKKPLTDVSRSPFMQRYEFYLLFRSALPLREF